MRDRTRLAELARMVHAGSRVADVGCDHGRLPALLLESGRASFCVATDVRAGCVEELTGRLRPRFSSRRLSLRRGWGLRCLRRADRLDTLVLAGLGARTIRLILDDVQAAVPRPVRLVLQPRTEPELVRDWLAARGYCIADESLILDRGRFHLTIAAERGRVARNADAPPPLERRDLREVGPLLARSSDPLVRRFWQAEFDRLERIIRRGAHGDTGDRAHEARERARRVLAALPAGTAC